MPHPPFIDRGRELEILERLWRRPGFKLALVYGRRRVGKTRLLREWLRDKRGAYYLAAQIPYREAAAEFEQRSTPV